MVQNSFLYTIDCGRFLPCILPPAPLILIDSLITQCIHYMHTFWNTLFHSLGGNRVGDSGATALADVLRVNQSLKTLK